MRAELHISSLLVHARPAAMAEVQAALAALAGVEVHGASPAGKLVVTLETASEGEILARLATIGALDGVLSTALVFHQIEAMPITEGA